MKKFLLLATSLIMTTFAISVLSEYSGFNPFLFTPLYLASFVSFAPKGVLAGFVTFAAEYNGQEAIDVLIRPFATVRMPKYLNIFNSLGANSNKLTFYRNSGNGLTKFATGYQGGLATDKIQKKFITGDLKMEKSYTYEDYKATVEAMAADISQHFMNEIYRTEMMETLSPAILEQFKTLDINNPVDYKTMLITIAELKVWEKGLSDSLSALFWLGDTSKITLATGTFPNKVAFAKYEADIRYNAIDGIWKGIEDLAVTGTPTVNQIKKIAHDNSAVANVHNVTLTGSSGTASIAFAGITKTATFASNLQTTAANFVSTANIAAWAAVGITLSTTSSGVNNGVVKFTAVRKGVTYDAPVVTNLTTDLDGTLSATAATAAGAMAAGEAIAKFELMLAGQSAELYDIDNSQKVIYCTKTYIENYKASLRNASSTQYIESQRLDMINGVSKLYYDGIEIIYMNIDSKIASDFGGYSPHRAILCEKRALAADIPINNFAQIKRWNNDDENETRMRVQLNFGCGVVFPELMVVAFQG